MINGDVSADELDPESEGTEDACDDELGGRSLTGGGGGGKGRIGKEGEGTCSLETKTSGLGASKDRSAKSSSDSARCAYMLRTWRFWGDGSLSWMEGGCRSSA